MAMIGTGQTFATYFAFAVDAICKVLWREGYHRGPQDLVRETGNRIRRPEKRFNALVARWRAGTLPAVETRSLGPDTPTPALPRLAGRGIAYDAKGLAARGDLDSLRFPDLCREALDGWARVTVCGG